MAEEQTGEVPEEVRKRIKEWAATTSDPAGTEAAEVARLNKPKHTPSEVDPRPGEQRHSARTGVPQYAEAVRGLRDRVDPSEPDTLPSPVKITRVSAKGK